MKITYDAYGAFDKLNEKKLSILVFSRRLADLQIESAAVYFNPLFNSLIAILFVK